MWILRVCLASLVVTFLLTSSVMAACRWEWLCDQWGVCSQAPICDSQLDIPPPQPIESRPMVPMSIKPYMPETEPASGTRQCQQIRRCNSVGICFWDAVCR